MASDDGEFVVTTGATDFHTVQDAIKAAGIEIKEAELTMVAANEIAIAGKDADSLLKLLDTLEDLDDVQKVHTNADIDEASLAEA